MSAVFAPDSGRSGQYPRAMVDLKWEQRHESWCFTSRTDDHATIRARAVSATPPAPTAQALPPKHVAQAAPFGQRRLTSIASHYALILPPGANPRGRNFRECNCTFLINMNLCSSEHEARRLFFGACCALSLIREKTIGGTVGTRVDLACVAVVGRGGNEPRQELLARTRALTLVWLLAFGLAALGTGDALSASRHKDIRAHRSKAAAAAGHKRGTALDAKRHTAALQSEESDEAVAGVPLPIERPAGASLPTDLGVAKQAIQLIRKSKLKDAAALAASISDPVAHKLIEWVLLRSSDSPGRIRAICGLPWRQS